MIRHLIAAILVMVSGCASPSQEAVTWDSDITITLTVDGGLCPDGPCERSVRVALATRTWEVTDESGIGRSGEVDAAATEALMTFVDDRWDALTAEAFDGTCPTAYDGQRVTLEYAALPTGPDAPLADADVRHTSNCDHVWPDGFLSGLERRWTAAGAPWPLDG